MKLKDLFIMSVSIRVLIVFTCISLVVFKYATGTKFESDLPPLIYSVMNLETEKVKKMLYNGFFVDEIDERNYTSLQHAVEDGDDTKALEFIRLLLSNFASCQNRNRNGQTVIHLTREIADISLRMNVIDWLVKNGANISERDDRGNTILDDLAGSNMATDLENTLVWWGDLFTKEDIASAKKNALFFEYDLTRKMLEKFDIKKYVAPRTRDLSALMVSILANDIQSVHELVLKANLKEGAEKSFGYRPLHIAVNANKLNAAQILLEQKADANAPDKNGNTPLFMVERLKNDLDKKAFIELLVQNNANINARNSNGDTVLHIAVRKRDLETTRYLLSIPGIVLTIKNNRGMTPKALAKELKYKEIQSLFGA